MTFAEILSSLPTTPLTRVTAYRREIPWRQRRITIGPKGPVGAKVRSWREDDDSSMALHPFSAFGSDDGYRIIADYSTDELRSWANLKIRTGDGAKDLPRVLELEPVSEQT